MTKKGLAGFSKTQASCCSIRQACPQAILKLCNRRNSVTGYAISTSAGNPVFFFDLFDIPAILPESEGLRGLAVELHYYLSYGAAILVAIHALAALKHQFIDKDGTLSKMLWSSSRPRI